MTHRLRVPYVSQLGPGAEFGTGDCGLTCVTAIARACGHPEISVDEVCRLTSLRRGFLGAHITGDVAYAARRLGIALHYAAELTAERIERELANGRPVILLVFYPLLERRFDPAYRDGHFILVHGASGGRFYYDDPYWPDAARGEDLSMAREALVAASWATGAHFRTPGQGLLLRSHQLPVAVG